MAYRDLREWIDVLEKAEEVQKIKKEVDWDLEVGAIIQRVYDLLAPAPLFEKIKDYPVGYRILGAPLCLSARNKYARLSLAMEIPIDSDIRSLTEEYLRRKKNPIKPILLKEGPCQENIHLGDELDLYEFPAPMIHEGDGGRYISTWHALISKDPDSGWVNYGMYRQMIHDRNHLGGMIEVFQHIGQHFRKYSQSKKRMEFATAIGTEPVTPLISCAAVEEGVDETDVIGSIRQAPLELVKCQTVDLMVPAGSEIVFEGYVEPDKKRPEGPFGEYTGYSAGGRELRPVYTLTAITHRNDPILTVSVPTIPVTDGIGRRVIDGAIILEELRDRRKLPVNFVYIPPEGVAHFAVVSTKVPYKTYPKHLAMTFWSIKAGMNIDFLMLVDDDVDITDLKQIMWILSTRVHPMKGIWQIPNTTVSPLLPWLNPEERKNREGAHVLFDATWPYDWPKEWIARVSSFKTIWPEEIQEKVLKSWKEYGFKQQ